MTFEKMQYISQEELFGKLAGALSGGDWLIGIDQQEVEISRSEMSIGVLFASLYLFGGG